MASNPASTVEEYLASLPDDRRAVISVVRDVILANLPEGFHEGIYWGTIAYVIPLQRYPKTYNKKPLCCVALSAGKASYSVHLLSCDSTTPRGERLRAEFAAVGKKLDMGKCCVRFKKLDDLPLEVIGRAVAEMSVDRFIEVYEMYRKAQPDAAGSRRRPKAGLEAISSEERQPSGDQER